MYNEQIESLITAALADCVLTDKEKNLLFKKAEAMGIDRDEFELVLEGRLAKRKKEMEAQDHRILRQLSLQRRKVQFHRSLMTSSKSTLPTASSLPRSVRYF